MLKPVGLLEAFMSKSDFLTVFVCLPRFLFEHAHLSDRISFNTAISSCEKVSEWQQALGLLDLLSLFCSYSMDA